MKTQALYKLFSAIVVAIFFLAATSVAFTRDLDNPYGILLFTAAIVLGSILLSARFTLYLALLTTSVLSVYMYGKFQGYWTPDQSWRNESSRIADAAVFIVMYSVMAFALWLLNRRLERARVLQATQIEQLQQVYRFAELGHLSTALFHDLANHIMSVNLDVESLQKRRSPALLERLQANTHHIQSVVGRVQGQIRGQTGAEPFDVVSEIRAMVKTLGYFSRQLQVAIKLQVSPAAHVIYHADLTRFRQIITNLLLNAVEAYQHSSRPVAERIVTVTVAKGAAGLTITVSDRGPGIGQTAQARLFEPFYTTKAEGMGIGLFIVKKAVEEDFGGTIRVTSSRRAGTAFRVVLPLNKPESSGTIEV